MKRLRQAFNNEVSLHTAALLVNCLVLLFVLPLFPRANQPVLYFIFHTFLLVICTTMVERGRRNYLIAGLSISALLLAARIADFHKAEVLIGLLAVMYFFVIAILIIKQLLRMNAGLEMILQAIGGYLLLGIALVFVMDAIEAFAPGSFLIQGTPLAYKGAFTDHSYYVFITYTTVGYGDILPATDLAKTYSKFVALCGQIYNSVIIAILVGKYLTTATKQQA